MVEERRNFMKSKLFFLFVSNFFRPIWWPIKETGIVCNKPQKEEKIRDHISKTQTTLSNLTRLISDQRTWCTYNKHYTNGVRTPTRDENKNRFRDNQYDSSNIILKNWVSVAIKIAIHLLAA